VRSHTPVDRPGTVANSYAMSQRICVRCGNRIAELVEPVARLAWGELAALAATARGTGGFGSTDRG